MIPIGFSASDLVLAVKVIHKVCSAYRDASGANQQYASTVAFLDAFARTLERLIEYTQTITQANGDSDLSDDLNAQMKLIYSEYVKFDNYLKKAEPGLSSQSFARRITARAKWAIKEIDHKVDELKRAVISPMMFVAPLLAVEILRELKDLRSQLPASSASQEAALRENRALILQTNSDIAHLRSNLDSFWWTRRWAMTAVEEDVKTLGLVVKNNTDLIESSRNAVQDTISQEASQSRREQAASNIQTISSLETVMANRLASIEAQIDNLIYETRQKTGKEDKELCHIRSRVSSSRKHLNAAANSARECLKHFGLLVSAINSMHRNPVTGTILPFANAIAGYNKIFEAGEKMVQAGGKTIKDGGKYIEESEVMANLKSWNPFTAAVQNEKSRLAAIRDTSTPQTPSPSHETGEPQPIAKRVPTTQDEGYDSGEETTAAISPTVRSAKLESPGTLSATAANWQSENEPRQSHIAKGIKEHEQMPEATAGLLLLDLGDSYTALITNGLRASVPQASALDLHEIHDNPWA